MNLQNIHDMASDALAGEELQFRSNGDWQTVPANHKHPFHSDYEWRIKPTVEVNGLPRTKRQALAAWRASRAMSYEYHNGTEWVMREHQILGIISSKYRWQEAKEIYVNSAPDLTSGMAYQRHETRWIYVNGEKIVRVGWSASCYGHRVGSEEDKDTLAAAIKKLIEIR